MKAGETGLIIVNLAVDMALVDSIIFTISGHEQLTMEYPGDVTVEDGMFRIPLSQNDTENLCGYYQLEAQINYKNKSVAKSKICRGFVSSTLATKFIDGSVPSGNEETVNLEIDSTVIVAGEGGGGTSDYTYLSNKPKINGIVLEGDKTAVELGIDVATEVAEYITEHKDELKGDKGDTGANGADGQDGADGYTPVRGTDYWTAEDITEIQSYIDSQIGGALNGSY